MATSPRVVGRSVLRGVPYDWYVRLRDDPDNRPLRMTYFDGVLEVMSPEFRHETGAERLGIVVRAVASAFGLPCTGARCTTFRRGRAGNPRGYGKEPDNSFYLANATFVRGKVAIDLEFDPPPDLWIEVDHRGSSRGRLPLYAALGIPEVWRYRPARGTLWFGRLSGGGYEPSERSLALPMLGPDLVLALLDRAGQAHDEVAWDDWMRAWLRTTLRPAYEAGAEWPTPPAPDW